MRRKYVFFSLMSCQTGLTRNRTSIFSEYDAKLFLGLINLSLSSELYTSRLSPSSLLFSISVLFGEFIVF